MAREIVKCGLVAESSGDLLGRVEAEPVDIFSAGSFGVGKEVLSAVVDRGFGSAVGGGVLGQCQAKMDVGLPGSTLRLDSEGNVSGDVAGKFSFENESWFFWERP